MDFVKRFNLTPHVEGGAFRELYRDGERAKERPAHGVIYYELGQGEASQFQTSIGSSTPAPPWNCGKSTTPS